MPGSLLPPPLTIATCALPSGAAFPTEPLSSSPGSGISRRITLEPELAAWMDGETQRLGLTSSEFLSILLEWARTEEITSDCDMSMLLPLAAQA